MKVTYNVLLCPAGLSLEQARSRRVSQSVIVTPAVPLTIPSTLLPPFERDEALILQYRRVFPDPARRARSFVHKNLSAQSREA